MKPFGKTLLSLALILLFSLNLLADQALNTPRVSIITSVFKGDDYIEEFLHDITRQTIFDQCELILINANSPGNEEPVIKKYMEQYPNIVYERLSKDPGIYGTWNIAIKKARGEYITNANLDDQRNPEGIALQVKALDENPLVDLVYSNCLLTEKPHETFEKNNHRWVLTPDEFSLEVMNLCLPGPQPMWRKSMHQKSGLFSERYLASGDLEMWNRAVSHGSIFKKIEGLSGLYYHNPEGLSTKKDSKQQVENKRIRAAYGYMWNKKSQDSPLLIKIATRTNSEKFFNSLNSYYDNLSEKVRYQFIVSLDETDETMNNAEVIEKLQTYPNLNFYFGKWNFNASDYNRDIDKVPNFEMIIVLSDEGSVSKNYDALIVSYMKSFFPQLDGVLNIGANSQNQWSGTHVVGKKYYERFGYIYHEGYQDQYFDRELTLVSKILKKEKIVKDISITKKASKENLKDQALFQLRRKENFSLSASDVVSNTPKLWSILIPTLESRKESFNKIYGKLTKQIHELGLQDKIEVLFFMDNRENSIGFKRNQLVANSLGKYICFVDDDDDVHDQYIKMISDKLLSDPDCVSLVGIITFNGLSPKKFIHSINYQTYFETSEAYFRPPNHLNPIRRAIGAQFTFPETSYGEDTDWAMQIAKSGLLKREEKISEPYYFYLYVSNK